MVKDIAIRSKDNTKTINNRIIPVRQDLMKDDRKVDLNDASDYYDVLMKLMTISEFVDNNVVLGKYKSESEERVLINLKKCAKANQDALRGSNKEEMIREFVKDKYTIYDRENMQPIVYVSKEFIDDEAMYIMLNMDYQAIESTEHIQNLSNALAIVSRNVAGNIMVENLVKPPITVEGEMQNTEEKKGWIRNMIGSLKRKKDDAE